MSRAIDGLIGMGLLQPVHVQDWKKGKILYLEKVIQDNLHKISHAMNCFRKWAEQKGLKPSEKLCEGMQQTFKKIDLRTHRETHRR